VKKGEQKSTRGSSTGPPKLISTVAAYENGRARWGGGFGLEIRSKKGEWFRATAQAKTGKGKGGASVRSVRKPTRDQKWCGETVAARLGVRPDSVEKRFSRFGRSGGGKKGPWGFVTRVIRKLKNKGTSATVRLTWKRVVSRHDLGQRKRVVKYANHSKKKRGRRKKKRVNFWGKVERKYLWCRGGGGGKDP